MTNFIYNLFAYPSAWLTAVFHDAAIASANGGELWILLVPRPIHVTPECCGFNFFVLLGGYTLLFILRRYPRPCAGPAVLLALPVVYVTTICANAVRMTCAYHVACLSRTLFPACFQPVIHMAVGIAVFLSALILSHLLIERIGLYGK
ncbi:MAG TPA: hypothetical protein PLD92_03120 [Candidatus Omnitrophota bacterium]|nr:hypothetical protein [Candidatus Omnitrophota bacterium]